MSKSQKDTGSFERGLVREAKEGKLSTSSVSEKLMKCRSLSSHLHPSIHPFDKYFHSI